MTNKELAPKAKYTNEVLQSTSTYTSTQIAKAIGCDVSELFEQPQQNTITCPNCNTKLKVVKE